MKLDSSNNVLLVDSDRDEWQLFLLIRISSRGRATLIYLTTVLTLCTGVASILCRWQFDRNT